MSGATASPNPIRVYAEKLPPGRIVVHVSSERLPELPGMAAKQISHNFRYDTPTGWSRWFDGCPPSWYEAHGPSSSRNIIFHNLNQLRVRGGLAVGTRSDHPVDFGHLAKVGYNIHRLRLSQIPKLLLDHGPASIVWKAEGDPSKEGIIHGFIRVEQVLGRLRWRNSITNHFQDRLYVKSFKLSHRVVINHILGSEKLHYFHPRHRQLSLRAVQVCGLRWRHWWTRV